MFSKTHFSFLVLNKYYLGCRNDDNQFTELDEFEHMSIDHCRNLAYLSGNTIFGLTYREKNNYVFLHLSTLLIRKQGKGVYI